MYFLIALLFYFLFLLFAFLFSYFSFSLFSFFVLLIYLLIYRIVLIFINQNFFYWDFFNAIILSLLTYQDISLDSRCFLFVLYYVCLESFTYTYKNPIVMHNSLTKSRITLK